MTKPLNFRESDFIREVNTFSGYPEEMRKEFIAYWTEPNKSRSKMRFEQEKTWDLSRRLSRWAANQKGPAAPAKIVPMHPPKPTTDIERMDALLLKYSKNPSGYSIESVKRWPAHSIEDCYRIIKEHRFWDPEITKQDIERMQGDQVLLKATVIIRTLNYYGLKGWMFSDTINARNKLVK